MRRDAIAEILRPAVEDLGCELWGVDFLSQGRHGLLRVFIERDEGGVTVDDCERVSRHVSTLLDVEDPIAGPYTLEVSSPGLDRQLFEKSHFERYAGARVKIRLLANYEGRRNFTGLLAGIEGEDVVLRVEDEELIFPLESIEKASVIPDFGNKSK